MASLEVQQLVKRYDRNAGVDRVGFAIDSGQFLTLLGPSGCGKTTTLRMVAGLVQPDEGRVLIGGRDVTQEHASRRNIGMVFQNNALFPHMSVAENVAFGLRMRGISRDAIKPRVARALEMVRLDNQAAKYPAQMSGGQQQRAVLARALVIEPSLLILDEPFAALDRKLREEMQTELRRLVKTVGITALFVTHDQEEALTLSDRIAVMNAGRVEQLGTPAEIFGAPRTSFIASFMGAANVFEARVASRDQAHAVLDVAGYPCRVPADTVRALDASIMVAVRPERIRLASAPPVGSAAIEATVEVTTYHGAYSGIVARTPTGIRFEVREPAPYGTRMPDIGVGHCVWLSWPDDAIQVLDNRSAPDPD